MQLVVFLDWILTAWLAECDKNKLFSYGKFHGITETEGNKKISPKFLEALPHVSSSPPLSFILTLVKITEYFRSDSTAWEWTATRDGL